MGGKSSFVVDGRLNAWGGSIAIDIEAPEFTSPVSTSLQAHNRSVWIGEDAVLPAPPGPVDHHQPRSIPRLDRVLGY